MQLMFKNIHCFGKETFTAKPEPSSKKLVVVGPSDDAQFAETFSVQAVERPKLTKTAAYIRP